MKFINKLLIFSLLFSTNFIFKSYTMFDEEKDDFEIIDKSDSSNNVLVLENEDDTDCFEQSSGYYSEHLQFQNAIIDNDLREVRRLVSAGQDIELAILPDGQTALEYSISKNYFDIVQYLIEEGVTITQEAKLLSKKHKKIEKLLKEFQNPLIKAIIFGNIKNVIEEVANGTDINVKYQGKPAFILALEECHISSWAKHKPTISLVEYTCNRTSIVEILLAKVKDFEFGTDDGDTPLLYILGTFYNVSFLQLLLSNKANYNAKDSVGTTPLIKAAKYGLTDAVKLLIKQGANKDLKDNLGNTALDYAKKKSDFKILKFLRN